MTMISESVKYLKIYHRYIGVKVYVVFALTTLMALLEGLGFTMLLPLLRVSQSSTDPTQLSGAEEILYELLVMLGISDSIVGVLLFITAIFFTKGIIQFTQKAYVGHVQASLLRELKKGFYEKYSNMKYDYYITQNAGHFINVINAQVNRFFQSFNRLASSLTKAVSAFSFFVFALFVSWQFAVMVIVIGAILLSAFQYVNRYVRSLSRKVTEEMSQLNRLLVQSLHAFKYILSTNQQKSLNKKISNSVDRLTKNIFRQRVAGAVTSAVRQPISVVIVSSVIIIQVIAFEEALAPIFVTLLLLHKGIQAVIALQTKWQKVMDQIGSVEIIDREMQSIQKQQEVSGETIIGELTDGIKMSDVSYSYNENESKVLENINVKIEPGETVALVGKSGAGKSTIIDMLTLLLQPDDGQLEIDGVSHDDVELASWRSKIGYVSQETVIFDDTIANNICLWEGDITEDSQLKQKVVGAARRAHAHEFIESMDDGYNTQVGDRGVKLSGGQRQRIYVARELYKQPELLLMDEATSDLDTQSERKIQNSIEQLRGDVTVVIVAHRLSTVTDADTIYVVENGRIVEKGDYDGLIQKNGQFKKMIEFQSV